MFLQTVSIVVLMSKKMKRILPIILLLIGFACSKTTPKATNQNHDI
jgi:outer membrane biogenesis lipoprotein LolB